MDETLALNLLSPFVERLRNTLPKRAVVGLEGPLGAGKTTLVREWIAQLAALNQLEMPRVTSPSFVIHQNYLEVDPAVEHFDLYRLSALAEKDLLEIGYYEALERCEEIGYVFVEWPSHASDLSLLQLTHLLQIVGNQAEPRRYQLRTL